MLNNFYIIMLSLALLLVQLNVMSLRQRVSLDKKITNAQIEYLQDVIGGLLPFDAKPPGLEIRINGK